MPEQPSLAANARKIKAEVDTLADFLGGLGRLRGYGDFWNAVREVNDMFASLHLENAVREALWARLASICEQAKTLQGHDRYLSQQKREWIERRLDDIHWDVSAAESFEPLEAADTRLTELLEHMKDGYPPPGLDLMAALGQTVALAFGHHGRMTREDHEACWSRWEERKNEIRQRKRELSGLAFEELDHAAGDAMNLADSDPRETMNRVKQLHAHLAATPMDRGRRSHIRGRLQEAWERARKQSHEHQDDWLERMQGHLDRWTTLRERKEDFIEHLEKQITKCEEMAADAKSEEFADTARGWIEEHYAKIDEVRDEIAELNAKIESVQKKLEGAG